MVTSIIIIALLFITLATVFIIALTKVLKSKGEVEVNMKLKQGEFNIKKK